MYNSALVTSADGKGVVLMNGEIPSSPTLAIPIVDSLANQLSKKLNREMSKA